ncbi:anthranilate phosphoribosyltransferase [Desulfocarbo indianensis]|nr:anthranilate phosphoribosyltransferase [Desulfocarbo indianensis]
MICQAIAKAVGGKHLEENEMIDAMDHIMEGRATPAQIAALLIALRMKGECVEEISGAAKVMRAKVSQVPTLARSSGEMLVDTVGTGGDGAGTFNVSTTTAFVVAGCGLKVAKHGNRAVSSSCGSADLIEALGIPLDLPPERIGQCVDQAGIGFLFAPLLHGAMRHAMGPRREIGLRTIFNLLGPLTNPAGATVLLVGVYDPRMVRPLAEVLARLGADSALVVHGEGGLDEITITGRTSIARLAGGEVSEFSVTPEEAGLQRASLGEIKGGDAQVSREQTMAILNGQTGPRRDMVLMNAAGALLAAGRAESFREGVGQAARSIDSGAAMARLNELVAAANQPALQAAQA